MNTQRAELRHADNPDSIFTSGRCVVCDSSTNHLLWSEKLPEHLGVEQFSYKGEKNFHGRIVECCSCHHRFVHPFPIHANSLYAEVEDPFYLATEKYRAHTFAAFLDLKESFVPSRGSLLDIGSYTGLFLEIAQKRGYRVSGAELSNWAASIARTRGFQVHSLPVEELDTVNESFDCITAFDVFEHLENPKSAAQEIRKKLNRGGCFFVIVPDMASWHAKLLGERHWLVILMHYHYFNAKNFKRLLLDAGFTKVETVSAPPYRLSIENARNWAKGTPLSPFFEVLGRIPLVKRFEIRLRASIAAICYTD